MKRMFLRSKVLPVMLAGTFCVASLSGCALLPAEDVGRVVPTVAVRETEAYNMVVVTRTDIVIEQNIVCNYTQKGGVDLSFETGGKKFEDVFVSKGSEVLEGDLLATLDMGNLDTELANLEVSIAEHEKELAQSLELMKLEIEKINVQYNYGMINATKRDSEIEKIENSYASTNAYLEETLYLEKLEYDTLTIKRQNSSIYAPMDGIVTYVSSEFQNSEKTSVQGKTMMTVTSAEDCTFQANTDYRDYFSDGDVVSITLTKGGTGTYDAVVTLDSENSKLMYLTPTEEISDLEIGARASFSITVDRRDNVLAVATGAVMNTVDSSYVYYVNADGVRDIKFIEIGISSGGMTEIISGLEYGEVVIKN